MKKGTNLALTIIAITCLTACGGNNNSQQISELEKREAALKEQESALKEKEDSLRLVEQQKAEEKRKAVNTWTAPNGVKWDIDDLMKSWYQVGVKRAQITAKFKYEGGYGTEKDYKSQFAHDLGIPTDSKSKDIYERGLKEYIKGYEAGWNFNHN